MRFCRSLVSACVMAMLFCAASCVKVNTQLGQNFRSMEQRYGVFTMDRPITEIDAEPLENLSAYNSYRMVTGYINDGSTVATRSCAFSIVPCYKNINLGKNTRFKGAGFDMVLDTLCVADENQKGMIQNLHVYALSDAGVTLDSTILYTDQDSVIIARCKREVTKGVPTYSGASYLDFSLSEEYGKEMLDKMLAASTATDTGNVLKIDSAEVFYPICPGFYMRTEPSYTSTGRINMFRVEAQYDSDNYLNGSYFTFSITADYGDRKDVDTTIVFLYGASDIVSTLDDGLTDQYAVNFSKDYTLKEIKEGYLRIQGGAGDKPVICARALRDSLYSMFKAAKIKPEYYSEVIINRASLCLPFDFPDDYKEMERYPSVLSPSCKIPSTSTTGLKYYVYVNLTDYSVTVEDHGEVNRSISYYTPDISFHAQKLLALKDASEETLKKYDIWLLIEAQETMVEYTSSTLSDYYRTLYYNSYLSQLYGGSSSSSTSNYYTMMYYYNMMNATSSNTSTSTELMVDRDRFYRGVLNGPETETGPYLDVVFSIPVTYLEDWKD